MEVTVEVLDVDMDREAGLAVAEGDPGRPVAALRPHPRDRSGRAGQGRKLGALRCVRPRRPTASRALVHIS